MFYVMYNSNDTMCTSAQSNALDIIILMRQITVIMKHVTRTVVSETAKVLHALF